MAPLPPESTARYFLDYSVNAHTHTMEVRASGAHSPASFGSAMTNLLGAIVSLLLPITVLDVRFAASGSTVSNIVVSGIEGAVFGTGTGTVDDVPKELNFVGRSTGGRRVRLGIFGYKGVVSTYRLTNAESSAILNATTILNGTSPYFFAIDGLVGVWKPYANILFNSYWQRKVRA